MEAILFFLFARFHSLPCATEYVELYVNWVLRDSILKQLEAFIEGFRMMFDPEVIKVSQPSLAALCFP